jgi:hypothetical protein
MSKLATARPQSTRTFLTELDPARLVKLLEEAHDDAYGLERYQEMRERFLEDAGDQYVKLAELFEQLDNFGTIEQVFRRAGFVTGFDACRQLILGEIDLSALKKAETDADEGGAQ